MLAFAPELGMSLGASLEEERNAIVESTWRLMPEEKDLQCISWVRGEVILTWALA